MYIYIITYMNNNASNGMMSKVWGPTLWHTLHIISFNYPLNPTTKQKKEYYKFLMSLKYIIPCKYCRDNFSSNLKKSDFNKNVFDNRLNFSKFIYEFHNIVNISLQKKKYKTYEEVSLFYEKFRSSCDKNKKKCKDPLHGNYKYKSKINFMKLNK